MAQPAPPGGMFGSYGPAPGTESPLRPPTVFIDGDHDDPLPTEQEQAQAQEDSE